MKRQLWDAQVTRWAWVVDASELDAARERERELIGLLRECVQVAPLPRRICQAILDASSAFDAREKGQAT